MYLFTFLPFYFRILEEEDKSASIKLTDYTVTAGLFQKEFYFAKDGTVSNLVRWLAPETIKDFTFSSCTDAVSEIIQRQMTS